MGMYLMRRGGRRTTGLYVVFIVERAAVVLVGHPAFCLAMLLVVLVPGLLALVFGWFAFRSKIKGVYFSIMTQALTYAGMLLFPQRNRLWR